MVTVRPHQHALPIVGLKATKPRLSVPLAPTDHRPIHVSGYHRRDRDYYATPNWVTEALLHHIRFRGPIWEPCCGAGAVSTVLAAHGYEVISTDIADYGFGTPGIDFLASRSVRDGCRSIIHQPGGADRPEPMCDKVPSGDGQLGARAAAAGNQAGNLPTRWRDRCFANRIALVQAAFAPSIGKVPSVLHRGH
jgi:hypothetical protein